MFFPTRNPHSIFTYSGIVFIRKIFYFALLAIFLTSCNKDYFTVGSELYNGEFEDLNSIVFPVFSYQESTAKVATNNLPNVHLGKYNDDVYGAIESSFVSQLDRDVRLRVHGLR